ncbi:MAG: DegT/DnrJ/EryC1/StrS family aminotransferase [Bdellovibrionota bacterium]
MIISKTFHLEPKCRLPAFEVVASTLRSGGGAESLCRALTPAESCVRPQDARRARRAAAADGGSSSSRDRLKDALSEIFPDTESFLFSSGTDALFRILGILARGSGRRHVLMSAYTCPDVAAAAVRVGLKVALIDVDPETLLLRPESVPLDLSKDVLAVILSNLYGLPDPIERWLALSAEHRFLVIDDACQSALSKEDDRRIGARGDAIGVLSFGRGKAFSGIGGGAVLLPSGTRLASSVNAAQIGKIRDGLLGSPQEKERPLAGQIDWARGFLLSVLARPEWYWLPSSIPFLGLGEAHCDLEFGIGGLTDTQAAFAEARIETLSVIERVYRANARLWVEELERLNGRGRFQLFGARLASALVAPTRMPFLAGSREERDLLLRKAKRFGVSSSYPNTLEDYEQLSSCVVHSALPGAKTVAARILTLPVHQYVTDDDRRRVTKLWRE